MVDTAAQSESDHARGKQRLPVARLKAWESLAFGMFIHFGMSTYERFSRNDLPALSTYAPTALDVDQWVQVARDAGMKYAMLTCKHATGFCLWPTDHTDYHVGNTAHQTDVVEAYVKACDRHGIKVGLYIGSYDVHNTFGSVMENAHVKRKGTALLQLGSGAVRPDRADPATLGAFTTPAYHAFQLKLLDELLTRYGPVEQLWIDAPMLLGPVARRQLYQRAAELQPDCVITCNNAFGDGSVINMDTTWPTDVVTAELVLPPNSGHHAWFTLAADDGEPGPYYVPAEICDSIARGWFHMDGDQPASTLELLGRRLVCRERHSNWLLNVPPDPTGRIPDAFVDALAALRQHTDRLNLN